MSLAFGLVINATLNLSAEVRDVYLDEFADTDDEVEDEEAEERELRKEERRKVSLSFQT